MEEFSEPPHYADLRNPKSWEQLGGAFACVLCAALAAGLTVGLMSLDPLELEVKRRVGTEDERKHAEKICPLISRHHRLLVTLLLFNSIANEALPIFLAELVPSYVAVLLSVTFILIFGEIIPSALFTGPKQIVMASRLSGFVYLLMGLFYPIACPIAWVLDRWLGGHHTFKRYTREELSTLVELQREDFVHQLRARRHPPTPTSGGSHTGGSGGGVGGGQSHGHGHGHAGGKAREKELGSGGGSGGGDVGPGERQRAITVDEATIVAGVLSCHRKRIKDAMKPMDEVYALCEEDVLDENRVCELMACGFSRIPIHSKRSRCDIRGFLLVKRLIVLDPEDKRPIKTLPLRQPIVVSPNGSLLELINVFQEGRSHMAIVSPCPDLTREALRAGKPLEGRLAPIGIITLEDLFEEILQEEIYDEMDARERKALETLRKVRRRVKRQRQQAAAAAAAGNGAGAGAIPVPVPPHESASTSTPGTLSVASSPAGSVASIKSLGLAASPRLLSGLFGGGSSSKEPPQGAGHGHGNGNGNGNGSIRHGYPPRGEGDLEEGAPLLSGNTSTGTGTGTTQRRKNGGSGQQGKPPPPHGAPPPSYGSLPV